MELTRDLLKTNSNYFTNKKMSNKYLFSKKPYGDFAGQVVKK